MRIVEIIPQLHMGGAEHFTVDLCNELSSRGHDVTLIVTNPVSIYGHFAQFLSPDVKLISMDKRKGADPMLFFRLPRLVRSLKPDIVHTHLGAILYNIFTPYIYRKAKYFHTIHSAAEKEATTGGHISAWARKWQFKHKLATPITISDESDISFKAYYGNKAYSVIIPNGVPIIEINEAKAKEIKRGDAVNLISVARIMPAKNHIELVKAVEALNKAGYAVELYIVGTNDTPQADEIRSLNPQHCHLLGPRNNPRDYVAASDAFVLSSLYEGMPLSLIECFSTGTIPICTPVGGNVNMIEDGVNGLLTAGTSSNEIADAIKRFCNLSQDEKAKMKIASRNSFEQYSMAKCVDNYLKLFSK